MDWRAIPPVPPFELSRLVEITGIPSTRIFKWQRSSAWPLPLNGSGNRRRYTIWDAVRAAIIRELSDAGLPITGKGQEPTAALAGAVYYTARIGSGDLSKVSEQVKLFRGPDGEWCVDVDGLLSIDDEQLGTMVVLIRLRQIAEKVAHAAAS
jgi:hypothetical protein